MGAAFLESSSVQALYVEDGRAIEIFRQDTPIIRPGKKCGDVHLSVSTKLDDAHRTA
jgi:hypothetical protein